MSRIHQDLNGHHSKQNSLIDPGSSAMLRRIMPKGRKLKVCVVGAGVAGMRCAQILGENGVDVTVLEARDRTGGRMHQTLLGGHPIDHGPNWIHGVNQNPILDLAKEINATTMPAPELPPSIYDQSGQLLSPEESQKCSAIMWGIIEEAFDYSNRHSASIPQEQSLLDFFKRKLKEKDLPPSTQERILQVCRSWGDYIGGSIESQSLKYFWLEETIDGENLFLASTYQPILEKITKDTYTLATVHLSTKVTSITSHPSSPSQNPQIYTSVTVTTSKDQTQEFDEVITTVPLGCLKCNHQQTFHPPLPSRIQTAIKNLSYGRLEKVYLTFPSAFWLRSSSTENPTTSNTTENLNPFFNQWLAPTYTPHHFPVECVFLSSLPSPHAHPTLLFYMHGPLASHITTLTSPLSPSSPDYLATLTEFFQPYYSRFPNFDAGKEDCTPSHALATDWTHDEFAGWGSYSNFLVPPRHSEEKKDLGERAGRDREERIDLADHEELDQTKVEQMELDHDIEALRHGCPERRLWFAGEHTSPFVALGTVTGAWWSGERVAGRVAGWYGIELGEGVGDGKEMEGRKVEGKRGGVDV